MKPKIETIASKGRSFRVRDDPNVRETYVSHILLTGGNAGNFIVTVGAIRFTPEKTNEQVEEHQIPYVTITGRLVFTPSAVDSLIESLQKMKTVMGTDEKPRTN